MREGQVVKEFETGGVKTVFRYPRWGDLDFFIEMHRTLRREKVMCRRLEMDRASGARMLADILVGLEEDRRSYLLVEREGSLAGEGFADKTGHLYCTVGIALVSRVRGLGIGTELMRALEQESRRLGAKRLHLTVWSANPAAMHVYQKVGYHECGRRPGWIRMDSGEECDLIEMVKT